MQEKEELTLNAVNMKDVLWNTLQGLKDGSIDPAQGDAIASQSREILRTTNTQLKILSQAKENVTTELVGFAAPTK